MIRVIVKRREFRSCLFSLSGLKKPLKAVDALHLRTCLINLIHSLKLLKHSPVGCRSRKLVIINSHRRRHQHQLNVVFCISGYVLIKLSVLGDDLFILLRLIIGFDEIAVLSDIDIVDLLLSHHNLGLGLQGHEPVTGRKVV